jgi:hypothetical protein
MALELLMLRNGMRRSRFILMNHFVMRVEIGKLRPALAAPREVITL